MANEKAIHQLEYNKMTLDHDKRLKALEKLGKKKEEEPAKK